MLNQVLPAHLRTAFVSAVRPEFRLWRNRAADEISLQYIQPTGIICFNTNSNPIRAAHITAAKPEYYQFFLLFLVLAVLFICSLFQFYVFFFADSYFSSNSPAFKSRNFGIIF
jgi:hypothetical protein